MQIGSLISLFTSILTLIIMGIIYYIGSSIYGFFSPLIDALTPVFKDICKIFDMLLGLVGKMSGVVDIVKNNIIEAVAYPNPATDKISIDFTTTEAVKATYSIVDMTGKIIATKDLGTLSTGANTVEIATANFAAGMYSIVLTTDKGTFQSKFTKK